MVEIFVRIAGMVGLGVVGWRVGDALVAHGVVGAFLPWGLVLTVAGCVLGLALTPYFTVRPLRRTLNYLSLVPAAVVVSGTLGLTAGLVVGLLASVPFFRIHGWPGWGVPATITLAAGVLGLIIGLQRAREVRQLLPGLEARTGTGRARDDRILVDTSAIIDGRIADLGQAGFLRGVLTVPRFVLDELQHVADSSDALRRNRGRRGLEVLNRLRKDQVVPLQIVDVDVRNGGEVDAKLVQLAKSWDVPILTTDFNLNRVAEIQGVRVLNVNELANALKPVVLPGEDLTVHIIQEGKETGQGVGFLDDGTMVVVEGGRRFINTFQDVTVTRVLQTAAGRIIFGQPKGG